MTWMTAVRAATVGALTVAALVGGAKAVAEPSHEREQVDPSAAPILLVVDENVSPEWHVEEVARLWEAATGCDLFTFEPTHPGQLTYRVFETEGLTFEGSPVAGLATFPESSEHWVQLNPKYKDWQAVPLHELGHVLGIHHTGDPADIMSGVPKTHDRLDLTEKEIQMARELNAERCL